MRLWRRSRSRSSLKPYDSQPLTEETIRQLGNLYRPQHKEKTVNDFKYTDSVEDIDSSAVSDAFYNIDDKQVAIVIQESDDVYVYSGVPSWVWQGFKGATSKGSYYATVIKRNYGPGAAWGNFYGIDFSEVSASVPAAPMGRVTLGTPKGLSYASDANVTTSAEAFPSKATTSVTFEVAGATKTANFDDIGNVEDAVSEIKRLADMMGLDDLKVRSVTVNFE